VREKS